jgi:hypothetical protein
MTRNDPTRGGAVAVVRGDVIVPTTTDHRPPPSPEPRADDVVADIWAAVWLPAARRGGAR